MGIQTRLFGHGYISDPFFSGTQTSTLAPAWLPIALGGHAYLIDPARYQRQTLPAIREQADQSDEPGEHSLNPRGLWRRSQESFHHGAGQVFLDAKDSDRARYRSSKGVDPWTRGQLSLLPDTANRKASANTNLALAVAGGYLYAADGTNLYHTTDPTVGAPTWTDAVINAGQGAQTVASVTTDGYNVWAALGSSGVHRTTRGAITSTADVPSTAMTLVSYAMGRLMGANGRILYEITDPLGAPAATALRTHPNTDFVWEGIAPGRNVIYAWGSSGDISEVYRITINPTDTALSAPIFATYLPDGEHLHSLVFYAGGIVMGTSKGVRAASVDGIGNIDYGPLIPVTNGVAALEPQDRYVWFGWTNYDAVSTGLGRVDLGFFVDQLVPAHASDLMATGQGTVRSAVTFGTRRYFAVSGAGIFGEATTKVATGTLETGQIRFATTDLKTARSIDLRHHDLTGTVAIEMRVEDGTYVSLGSSSGQGSAGPVTPISARSTAGETFEFRFTLSRSATDTTLGPELVRWTMRSLPTPRRDEQFSLPILFKTLVENAVGDGQDVYLDLPVEMTYLKDIESTGRIITLQVGDDTHQVFIDRISFEGESWEGSGGRRFMEGTLTVLAQTVGD